MATHVISSSGSTSAAAVVNYQVSADDRAGANSHNAADFPGGVWPSGSVTLPAGGAPVNLTISINPDADVEGNETYKVTLTSNDPNVTFENGRAVAYGTSTNDDTSSGGGSGLTSHGTTAYVEPRSISGRPAVFKADVPALATRNSFIQFLFSGSGPDAYCAIEITRKDGKTERSLFDKAAGASAFRERIGPGNIDLPATAFVVRFAIETDGSLSVGVDGQAPAFTLPEANWKSFLSGNTFGDYFGFRSAQAYMSLTAGTACTNVASGVPA